MVRAVLLIFFSILISLPAVAAEQKSAPLAVGAKLPVVKLTGMDGKKAPLGSIIDQQKTVLIFYRGGW